MPRKGPRRTAIAVRLSDDGRNWLDQRALDEGLTIRRGEPNRSEMARIAFAYAAQYMPKGWRPAVGR